jgi:hypothetical protein
VKFKNRLRLAATQCRDWLERNAEDVLGYCILVSAFLAGVSLFMAVLWWLPGEFDYASCLNEAQGDRDAIRRYTPAIEMYNTLSSYLFTIAAPMAATVITVACRWLVTSGRYMRRRIAVWAAINLAVNVVGAGVYVYAWCTYLIG